MVNRQFCFKGKVNIIFAGKKKVCEAEMRRVGVEKECPKKLWILLKMKRTMNRERVGVYNYMASAKKM